MWLHFEKRKIGFHNLDIYLHSQQVFTCLDVFSSSHW